MARGESVDSSQVQRGFTWAVTVTVLLTGILTLAPGVWAAAMPGNVVSQHKVVGPYRLLLQIGPPEGMGKNGGMGSGMPATCSMPGMSMSMSASMAMKTCNHHLELHVLNVRTGKPVPGLHVSISMRNVRTGMTIVVPVMTMGKGSDFHYGNNIYAPPGVYTVRATVNAVKVQFSSVRLM